VLIVTGNLDLEPIKDRCKLALHGPWVAEFSDEEMQTNISTEHEPPNVVIAWFGNHGGSAEFCAHARNDVPALIAEVERLKGEYLTLWDEFCATRDRNVGLQKSVNELQEYKASVPEASIRYLAQTDGLRGGSLQWDRVSMWIEQLDRLEDLAQPEVQP
jgi:hypothetical protein